MLKGSYKRSGPSLACARLAVATINPVSANKTTKQPTAASAVRKDQNKTILILGYYDKYEKGIDSVALSALPPFPL